MKLSDKGFNIEAEEYYRGCQAVPTFPDTPFATVEFYAGKNLIKIIPAKIAPFDETIFRNDVNGWTYYKKLSAVEFFYIIVIINGNIEEAYVPDEIFNTSSDAETYALKNQFAYAKLR